MVGPTDSNWNLLLAELSMLSKILDQSANEVGPESSLGSVQWGIVLSSASRCCRPSMMSSKATCLPNIIVCIRS